MRCCLEVRDFLLNAELQSDNDTGVATNIQSSIQRENWDMPAYMASSYVHLLKV